MLYSSPNDYNPRFTNKLPKVSMNFMPDSNHKESNILSSAGQASMPTQNKKSIFAKHYKEITFDTLKERHDNFSFEKVLESKNQVFDTIHFNNVVEKPNNPNLILFMKQPGTTPGSLLAKDLYMNNKYQNNSESASFYN